MIVELSDVADMRGLRGDNTKRMLRHLMDSRAWVSTDDLAGILCNGCPDGGHLGTHGYVRFYIHRIRKALRPGYQIVCRREFGYRLEVDEEVLAALIIFKVAEKLAA